MSKTTWRKLITEEMAKFCDHWGEVVGTAIAPPDELYWLGPDEDQPAPSFDRVFESESGGLRGDQFTVWTRFRVYFPGEWEGNEYVLSVPRDPCEVATKHV